MEPKVSLPRLLDKSIHIFTPSLWKAHFYVSDFTFLQWKILKSSDC